MQKSYLVPLAEAPASDRMSFVMVMNFVMRNFRFMLLVGLGLAVVSPLPLIGRKPTYTATTRFLTEAERGPGGFLGQLELPATAGRGPQFYLDLMGSPVVLESVVRAPLELEPGKPPRTLVELYTARPPSDSEAVRAAAGRVAGSLGTTISGTGIITLRVKADDPHVAAATTHELLRQTDAFNAAKMHTQARRERQFAEERLRLVERERDAAEADWINFNRRNRVVASMELQIEHGRLSDSLSRKRSMVAALVGAIERSRLDEIRQTPSAIVLSPALPPSAPSNISWKRVALVGLFAGMILGALIAMVRTYFSSVESQPTPEAKEFAILRAASTERMAGPFRALVSSVRRQRQPPLQ